jgi:protease I
MDTIASLYGIILTEKVIGMTKTVALVIAERMFRDEEYQIPKTILEQAGITVLTVSTILEKAIGKLGLVVQPDVLLKELKDQPLDALIFIGGSGSCQYFEDKTAHELTWHFYNQGKIVGAICSAPVILAKAGLLKGRKATVFPADKDHLAANGVIYTGSQVEIDDRLITGCGAEVSEQFGKELLALLQKNN